MYLFNFVDSLIEKKLYLFLRLTKKPKFLLFGVFFLVINKPYKKILNKSFPLFRISIKVINKLKIYLFFRAFLALKSHLQLERHLVIVLSQIHHSLSYHSELYIVMHCDE